MELPEGVTPADLLNMMNMLKAVLTASVGLDQRVKALEAANGEIFATLTGVKDAMTVSKDGMVTLFNVHKQTTKAQQKLNDDIRAAVEKLSSLVLKANR